jgi:predicted phosphoribosyltransferase
LVELVGERGAPELAARPLVLALPRGGVPVGYELAQVLGAPLDVVAARRIWAPGQPELTLGAVAPGGVRVLREALIAELGVSRRYVDCALAEQALEAEQATTRYHRGRPAPQLAGRTVVVVDDGLASGATASAALNLVRREGAARLLFAVPVAAAAGLQAIRGHADEVLCLREVVDFGLVSQWYEDFSPLSETDVLALLLQATAPPTSG